MSALRAWLVAAGAVCAKDLRAEFRTRYALSASGLFALTTLVAVSLALGPWGVEQDLLAALLWIVLFFAALAGLARTFVHEEEAQTAPALRLAAPAGAVYLGKYLFNLVLLLLLEVLLVPLFIVLLGLHVGSAGLFVLVLLLGSLGLAGTTTIVAALVARASARGTLLTVLAFPLLLPLLLSAIAGTRLTLAPAAGPGVGPFLQVLGAYAVALVTASLLLFPVIWNE